MYVDEDAKEIRSDVSFAVCDLVPITTHSAHLIKFEAAAAANLIYALGS